MALFDDLMKKEEYRKLFDQLPEDQKPIIMESIRKLVEQFENNVLSPIQNLIKK